MPKLPTPRRVAHRAPSACLCVLTGLSAMSVSSDPAAQAVDPAIARSMAKTQKPPLHGRKWMAITGKPLAATAGAMMFERGGNAVDAACAMIAATSTMWDVLSWGGETQALVTATLGTAEDQQKIETVDGDGYKRFMLHYNFPPFSVGEVQFLRGPGRREIGHGALAERALARIRHRQPGQVLGVDHRRVGHRTRRRRLARGPVGQPPHLGEALRARLRLEEVPVEGARQPERLVGQAPRRVLGVEIVEPERERDPVDRLPAQRGHHPLPLRHERAARRIGKAGGTIWSTPAPSQRHAGTRLQ